MTRPAIQSISPFFIVSDVSRTIAFYCDKLGFAATYKEPQDDPFFAIVCRDGAMLFVKTVGVSASPNPLRDPGAKWDAYVYTADPDALADDFARRGAVFKHKLQDTSEGLRGFEVADPDGYVLFFGRPRGE